MKIIKIYAQAEQRLQEIIAYYTENESAERTLKVIDSFDEAFTKIARNPQSFPKIFSTEFINLDIEFTLITKPFTSTLL